VIKKITLVIFLLSGSVAHGQQPFSLTEYKSAFAFEQITVAATSIGFTLATYDPTPGTGQSRVDTRAELATVNCDNNAGATIRARWDGTAPTAAIGVTVIAGADVAIYGYRNITNFRAIRTAATSVICNVHFYRRITNLQ